MKTQLAALVAAIALAAPFAANAQDVPSYAEQGQQDQQIKGRIVSFDGSYNLQVRDDNGYVDNVQLHDGTIINPTGLTLSPNMVVSILGTNGGNAFEANEIDTPYNYDAGIPYYEGHPWDYYGPTIGLSFFFGSGSSWWHGPGYGYDGFRGYAPYHGGYGYGYRTGYNSGRTNVYNNVHVNNGYTNNGNYHNTTTYHGGTVGTGYVRPAGSPRYLQTNGAARPSFQGGAARTTNPGGAPRFRANSPQTQSHASAPHNNGGGGGEHRH